MHRICFIDDDERFEIPLFQDVFGGEGSEFDVITATDFLIAKSKIDKRADWSPHVFVLDLYFPTGEPDNDAIGALLNNPPEVPNDRADIRGAYSNYLRAESRLKAVLSANNQGPQGGLHLAKLVAKNYPRTPIVFYSRKATFEDVVSCMACEGVRWVEKKPTGDTDEDTKRLTHASRDRIARSFKDAMSDESSTRFGVPVETAAKVILKAVGWMFDGGPPETTPS